MLMRKRLFSVVTGCAIGAVAGWAHADTTAQLSASVDYNNLLKNGSTAYIASIANDSASSGPIDWVVNNNSTSGLVISGSGSNLAPNASVQVNGLYTGSSYGTYNITSAATGSSGNSPVVSDSISVNVGEALGSNSYTEGSYTTGQLHTYGPVFSADVAPGGSYAGLSSRLVGLVGGGSDFLGTEMVIRDGLNTAATTTTVTMAWRNRTDIEVLALGYPHVHMQWPPLAYDAYNVVSDVVEISGMQGPYVLENTYDDTELFYEHPEYQSEAFYASLDRIYLGWFEPGPGGTLPDQAEWTNAVEGNSTVGSLRVVNYQGSFDNFVASHGDFNFTDYLGSYGVDIDNNTVWAVLDHNSEFATVPEPSGLALLGFASLAGLRRARRPN